VQRVPDPSSLDLAKRLGASAQLATVHSSTPLSPSLHEVVLRSDASLAGVAGNDVMIRLQDANGRFVRRRYSVRAVDPSEGLLTFWIVTSHEGPGASWAKNALAGDDVDIIGPRGKIVLDPLADWHLFMGDTSGLAAFYRMAQSIEVPGRAIFMVEVDTMDDAVTAAFDEGLGVTGIFVERQSRALNDPAGLLSGLSAFAFPEDEGHAYLFGEFSVTKVLLAALLDRGLKEESINRKAYWRYGLRNAEHGEPEKDA
jgi:NADPH-dependent ferric siderophore reductase